jgi:hypothetical protein
MNKTMCSVLVVGILFAVLPERVAGQGNCPAANPNDLVADDAAINACLSGGGLVSLADGSPGYIIRTGLAITQSATTFQGASGRPKIVAHPDLDHPLLVSYAGANSVTIQDLSFDGNRASRTQSQYCSNGPKWEVFNLRFISGSGWQVRRIDSDNAFCGSGLEIVCDNCIVENSRFRNNGAPYNVNPTQVSDGLTVWSCTNGKIRYNDIQNNTDVNLVVGSSGGNCETHNNSITQTILGQVGLNVSVGDHIGSRVHSNTISSAPNMLAIGLVVGNHPWDPNSPLNNAGQVDSNTITGSVILAAVDGAGTGSFVNNNGSGRTGTFPWQPCQSVDYTAQAHGGSITLQPGYVVQSYHNNACQ